MTVKFELLRCYGELKVNYKPSAKFPPFGDLLETKEDYVKRNYIKYLEMG